MGQATSSPAIAAPLSTQPAPEANRRRSTPWRRSFLPPPDNHQHHDSALAQRQGQRPQRSGRSRSASVNRLSQLLHMNSSSPLQQDEPAHRHSSPHSHTHDAHARAQQHDVHDGHDDRDTHEYPEPATPSSPTVTTSTLRPSRLQRARTSINASISNLSHMSFRRTSPPSSASSSDQVTRPTLQPRAVTDTLDFSLPDVSQTALDLDFDALTTTVSAGRPATPRTPSRRSSLRLPNGLSDRLDRLSGFRSDRAQRSFPRRRRSPNPAAGVGSAREGRGGPPGEDNTALLSRLLSVAAAATAATLLEGNQQAIADARSVAGDGDDGTFNSFLQSLESGRLAAALRGSPQNNEEPGASANPPNPPLNFFRMFRFGSPAPVSASNMAASNSSPSPNATEGANTSPLHSPESNTDGRMVPIIIVGIRSVNPASGTDNPDDNGMPPFLDALSALPTTPFGDSPVDHDSIDNILRSPRNGTHFTHRRRASMGGVNSIASGYDAQRHHRSPDRAVRRPMSVASESTSTPHPPPATPATSSLSRLASTASIAPTSRPNSVRSTSRRESIIRTTTTTTLESTSEDAPLRPRVPRQRRLSESDYRATFSSRRNGIVEPDNPSPPSENTRSWIIYVLGGSYPENHPILTTPSLFTDSPTYEDMMLLSALLGPAKPPVASEQDVANAGGILTIEAAPTSHGEVMLVAVAADRTQSVQLVDEQRCLVCLCDFEADEQTRQLVKCKHLFHRECIDEWLTKGRNSCPLCRGQGVDEKDKTSATPVPTSDTSPSPSGATSSSASFVDAASMTA